MSDKIRILDSVIEIAPELQEGGLLAALYRHMATPDPATARLLVELEGGCPSAVRLERDVGPPAISRLQTPASAGAPIVEAHRALLDGTLGQARDSWVLHAGAVALGGRALLILGESWAGKTTLVEALLQRGFTLLSDDYAPLRPSDAHVLPFPRALGRRGPATDPLAPPLLARLWIDPAELAPLATEPAPVGAIAVLEDARPAAGAIGARPAGAHPAGLRPLPATETLSYLLAALRNPLTAPAAASGLAALAVRVPAAALQRGPLDAMARAAAALLGKNF